MNAVSVTAGTTRRHTAVRIRFILGRILSHALMIGLSIVMVVPFYTMLVTSFMSLGQAYSFPPSFLPSPVVWSNYPAALALEPFGRYFFNSTVVEVLIT